MRDHVVRLGACLIGGDGSLFKDLKPGERFRFPLRAEVFTKLPAARWYSDSTGGRWRTSVRCAVVRVEREERR